MMKPHVNGAFIGKLLVLQEPNTPIRDSESLAITYDVMATTRLIVYLNASFSIAGNVEDRSFNLAENCNKGQRIT